MSKCHSYLKTEGTNFFLFWVISPWNNSQIRFYIFVNRNIFFPFEKLHSFVPTSNIIINFHLESRNRQIFFSNCTSTAESTSQCDVIITDLTIGVSRGHLSTPSGVTIVWQQRDLCHQYLWRQKKFFTRVLSFLIDNWILWIRFCLALMFQICQYDFHNRIE